MVKFSLPMEPSVQGTYRMLLLFVLEHCLECLYSLPSSHSLRFYSTALLPHPANKNASVKAACVFLLSTLPVSLQCVFH